MPHRLARLTASLMLADVITFDFLRNLATRWLMSARTVSMSGKIFLTALMIRRQHGQAGYRTGPEGGGAGRGALPEPPPRAGDRPGYRRQRLRRPPGRGAGHVRDSAPGQHPTRPRNPARL